MALEITIWDVQHGSASYVRTPNGRHIVIDLGTGSLTSNGPFSPLLHLKNRYSVNQLDEVIITHPHEDHIDDIFNFSALSPRVLRRPRHLSAAEIIAANGGRASDKLRRYFEISDSYTSPVIDDPEASANNGGVEISTFSSTRFLANQLNDHSLVTFFSYARSTICLPGDNEAVSWMELLQIETFRQLARLTNVLAASHHGRHAGYCPTLFTHCNPSLVIVSDGPAAETEAIDSYRSHVRQRFRVWSRSREAWEERRVLTTRRDGVIRIRCYWENTTPRLEVSID